MGTVATLERDVNGGWWPVGLRYWAGDLAGYLAAAEGLQVCEVHPGPVHTAWRGTVLRWGQTDRYEIWWGHRLDLRHARTWGRATTPSEPLAPS